MREIARDPARGLVEFRVRSQWKGRTRSRAAVESYTIGGQVVHRHFTIDADQPFELQGRNTAPSPQELLLAALNACLTVGYVAAASLRGITLERLEVETASALDLRGLLGLDPPVPPGDPTLRYTVRIKGDGTAEQFREIHEAVARTSPNHVHLARPVRLDGRLVVEDPGR